VISDNTIILHIRTDIRFQNTLILLHLITPTFIIAGWPVNLTSQSFSCHKTEILVQSAMKLAAEMGECLTVQQNGVFSWCGHKSSR